MYIQLLIRGKWLGMEPSGLEWRFYVCVSVKNMDSSDIVIPDIVCEAVDLANTVDDITRDVCSRGEALVCSPYKGPVGQPPTKRRKVTVSNPTADSVVITDPFPGLAHGTCSGKTSTAEVSDIVCENPFPPEKDRTESEFVPEFSNAEKLYPDSSISLIQALSLLLSWFSAFPGISKELFSHLLTVLHVFLLPAGNVLPTSYASALKHLKPFLSPIKEYHCCVNDCVMFRNSSAGEYEKLLKCPICDEPRFMLNDTTPRKKFKYISVATRLQRYFANTSTSKMLQMHSECVSDCCEIVTNIHQSKAWHEWYNQSGVFQGESRSISFALCTDGLNPFSNEKTRYSMWPMFLVPLNMPQSVRMKSGSMFLAGIIPGPKEPKNMDPYIDVLVDDILDLEKLVVYDEYRKEHFTLKGNILLHVLDYPGQTKPFKSQGAGAYAGCTYCCIEGEYSKALTKMVYLNHRSFLPVIDTLRTQNKGFPSSTIKPLPFPKNMQYIDSANARYSVATSTAEMKELSQETGCKGPYSLRRLPFHDRYQNTPVEPMHLLKNIAEHIVKLLSGITDSVKVRLEEKYRRRFKECWVEGDELPPAPFQLKPEEKCVANNRAVRIKVPHGTDWNVHQLFSKVNLGRMKSIEWRLVLSGGILKYCLRGLLGDLQRRTLLELCDVVVLLSSDEVNIQNMDSIEYRVHRVLSLLERDFPVSLHVMVFHLLHHLPMFVRRFGPIRNYWMYPMERFNSWISRRVLNRRFPEATVLETYRVFELMHFLQISGQLPSPHTNNPLYEDLNGMLVGSSSASGERESDHSHTVLTLDSTKLRELDAFYLKADGTLVAAYNSEKKLAKTLHRLKAFPPLELWLPDQKQHHFKLSASLLDLRKGPTDFVKCFRTYSVCINHTLVKYTTEASYRESSHFDSSYIHLSIKSSFYQGTMLFGRLQMIFKHVFNHKKYVLAYVNWFEGFSVDLETGLYSIDLNSSSAFPPIVPIHDLSHPLMHATDCQDNNKLWIINCNQKFTLN